MIRPILTFLILIKFGCFSYHHSIASALVYGLREALAIFCAEGIEASNARHKIAADRLCDGVIKMGLELFVERTEDRLPTVTAIKVPANVDWKAVSEFAMKKYFQCSFEVVFIFF